ncbi:MAG: Na/Pi cotransporter family protein [Chitinivibrionia bacterium]|nr:Na/Pi cotransporter family protein [Chitinivibrionia bacterium]
MVNDFLLEMIFKVIGGIGIFLLGMRHLSEGLQTIAGNRLRKMISMATPNRFMAVGMGTLVTCIIQSSTATTVMTVGFVNAGLVSLYQAIGIIMGANIGTTLTGWMLAINIDMYGLLLMGISAFVYIFSKNEKIKYTAMVAMGIGMIFTGLWLMKDGFRPIRSIPEYIEWFSRFSADTYFGLLKCVLVGCLLTLIVQSSTATIGITMGLAASGVIPFETAAALVVGENLGTVFTAYLASIGTTTNGKRAALAHISFNVIGVIWITTIFGVYLQFIRFIIGNDPNTMVMVNDYATYPYILAAIAAVHTVYNVMNTALFLPFTRIWAKILEKTVKDKPTKDQPKCTHLDKYMLNTPTVAIAQSWKEIANMGEDDQKMFDMLKTALSSDEIEEKFVNKVFKKEDKLDKMQTEITAFLTQLLSSGECPPTVSEHAQKQIRLADEFETISDYITMQLKLYLRINNDEIKMPAIMREELLGLHDAVFEFFNTVNHAYREKNTKIVSGAYDMGEAITQRIRELRGKHIARLAEAPTPPLISTTYPDMLVGYRRIKEHIVNIAEVMVGKGGYAGKITQG